MKLRSKLLVLLLAVVFAFSMFAMAACDDGLVDGVTISLSDTEVTLTEGGTYKDINATVKGSDETVDWVVANPMVATIESDGNTCRITPVAAGSTIVIASVGKKTAKCTVKVEPDGAAAEVTITLSATKVELTMGGAAKEVTATVTGTETAVEWSATGDCVTLTKNGNKVSVAPKAVGSGSLIAKIGTVEKTIPVTVAKAAEPGEVTITLQPDEVELTLGGGAQEVTAIVTNSEEIVKWSVTGDDCVTLTEKGNIVLVTPKNLGTATLKAELGDVSGTATVTVSKPAVSLTLNKEKVELDLDDEDTKTTTVVATVENYDGEDNVEWTIGDDEIAEKSVSDDGLTCTVTAVAVGTTTLTASIGGATKTIEVVVDGTPDPEHVELTLSEEGTINLLTGGGKEITASVKGTIETPKWSVDNDVVTLSAETGTKVTVTAAKAGDAVLTVTVGEGETAKTATLNIHVDDPTTITLSTENVELVNDEESDKYTATVTATVTGPTEKVTWSIVEGGSYITVTGDDTNTITVTAKAVGTAKIKASIGEVEKVVTVTVKAGVTLDIDNYTLDLKVGGADGKITAIVSGTEDAVTCVVEEGDDKDVVEITVGDDGRTITVKPLKEGEVTLIISVGGKTAECEVTVTSVPVIEFTTVEPYNYNDGVTIWFKGLFTSNLVNQSTMKAEASITKNGQPVTANAVNLFNAEIQFQINGTQYDNVVAVFTIVEKEGGAVVATARLEYKGVTELILSDETLGIQVEKTAEVKVVKLNGSEDLNGKAIKWTIASEGGKTVATIEGATNEATVTVKGVAEGKATLTCEIDGITATCAITVTEGEPEEEQPIDVTGKLFQQEIYNGLNIGIRLDCDAELGKSIGKTKESVEVTATADGEPVTITIHEVYGDGPVYVKMAVSAAWTCRYVFTIKYKNAAGKVIAVGTFIREGDKSLKLDASTLQLKIGETDTGKVTATTSGKIEGTIQWSIDGDNKIATIEESEDKTYVTVTAVASGTATITATVDGLTATCKVTVVGEGEEPPTPTVPTVKNARIIEVYGGDVHVGLLLEVSDELSSMYAEVASKMAYVKVNGVKNNDMKDMFAYGADGSYRVNVYMGGPVQKGVDYVFEICDADGNVLLQTVAVQWN
ncbi:MAG: Ig-like domain-containing protein [Clostridiales bacterium]|nr:Ig-like domain-containing protein [Clostridiales bacterium]